MYMPHKLAGKSRNIKTGDIIIVYCFQLGRGRSTFNSKNIEDKIETFYAAFR